MGASKLPIRYYDHLDNHQILASMKGQALDVIWFGHEVAA